MESQKNSFDETFEAITKELFPDVPIEIMKAPWDENYVSMASFYKESYEKQKPKWEAENKIILKGLYDNFSNQISKIK